MNCENQECNGDIISIWAETKGVAWAVNGKLFGDIESAGPCVKGYTSNIAPYKSIQRHREDIFCGDIDFNFCLKCGKIQGLESVSIPELILNTKKYTEEDYTEELYD